MNFYGIEKMSGYAQATKLLNYENALVLRFR